MINKVNRSNKYPAKNTYKIIKIPNVNKLHLFSYFKLLFNFIDSDSIFAVAERQTALHANLHNVGSLSIPNIH